MKIVLSRKLVSRLASMSLDSVRVAIHRKRLVQEDVFDGTKVCIGITIESVVAYCGWSPRTVDEILANHGIDPGKAEEGHYGNIYLTDVGEGA